MIVLYTDFGWRGPYVGQMHLVLAAAAPGVTVVDLMHDAPAFAPAAAGHLLAALVPRLPLGAVCVAVIDPGVGTGRDPVVLEADGRWFVGPANGLFNTLSARSAAARWWRIDAGTADSSATFHGRDLFAPVGATLARGEPVPGCPIGPPHGPEAAADRPEVVYIDAYGNAMTGLRAPSGRGWRLDVGDRAVSPGRTFADVGPGEATWLVNSVGLVEIAVNQGSAASVLGLGVGSPVAWAAAH